MFAGPVMGPDRMSRQVPMVGSKGRAFLWAAVLDDMA
jgi:hypothetical protein